MRSMVFSRNIFFCFSNFGLITFWKKCLSCKHSLQNRHFIPKSVVQPHFFSIKVRESKSLLFANKDLIMCSNSVVISDKTIAKTFDPNANSFDQEADTLKHVIDISVKAEETGLAALICGVKVEPLKCKLIRTFVRKDSRNMYFGRTDQLKIISVKFHFGQISLGWFVHKRRTL